MDWKAPKRKPYSSYGTDEVLAAIDRYAENPCESTQEAAYRAIFKHEADWKRIGKKEGYHEGQRAIQESLRSALGIEEDTY